jgi:glutathione S-transferase
MLTVHHLGVSQSGRIVWLCEELEIPYRLVRYNRDPKSGAAPPAYKALHPVGTAPIITDGDLVLAESGAIIEYVIAKHGGGRLAPAADSPDFADYLFWFHYANASMMPSQLVGLIASRVDESQRSGVMLGMMARADTAFALVEQRLGQANYFAGSELTAADILMLYQLTTMRSYVPRDLSPYPNIRAYLQRIAARPAYQRAMAKADPDLPLEIL